MLDHDLRQSEDQSSMLRDKDSLVSAESMETTRTISTTPIRLEKTLEEVQKMRKSITLLHEPTYGKSDACSSQGDLERLDTSIHATEDGEVFTDTAQSELDELAN